MSPLAVSNELDRRFEEAREQNRVLLMPYLTAGFPRLEGFVDLACALFEAGADALEIGIPFSDPLLDGPTIQHSQQHALDHRVTPTDAIRLAREIHGRSYGPLLLMGAFNPMLAFGLDRLTTEVKEAGVSGLIVPDLPLEEQGELRQNAALKSLHVIEMIAPTSSDERLKQACEHAGGFIYCVSVAGVTGARHDVSAGAKLLVERMRAVCDLPLAVGFGISGPEQAASVATFADGVIVGAALIDLLSKTSPDGLIAASSAFIASLRSAMDSAR